MIIINKAITVGMWSICLGFKNKNKDVVNLYILPHQIGICCVQETEMKSDHPKGLLSFPGYTYEAETNLTKSRIRIYINTHIKYARRADMEGSNSHNMILDIKGTRQTR